MRTVTESKLLEALRNVPTSSIIPVLEKGLEVEKLENEINQSETSATRIRDTEILLTLFYLRSLDF